MNVYAEIRAASGLNGTDFGRLLDINKHAVSLIENGRRIPGELLDGLYAVLQRAVAHEDYTAEKLRVLVAMDLMATWCWLFQLGFDQWVIDPEAGKISEPVAVVKARLMPIEDES